MPILRGEEVPVRGIGWMYNKPTAVAKEGYAFRYGKWKYVVGGISCDASKATFDCMKPQLYDMDVDFAENHDLALKEPAVLKAIAANFTTWHKSILNSMANESKCSNAPTPPPGPGPAPTPTPFPPHVTPSSKCVFTDGKALSGSDVATGSVPSKEACCGACIEHAGCVASDYVEASPMRPTYEGVMTGGTCHLKGEYLPKKEKKGQLQTACYPH